MVSDTALTTALAWSLSGRALARLRRPALSTQTVALVVTRCLRLLAAEPTSSNTSRRVALEVYRHMGERNRVYSKLQDLLPWGQAEDWRLCLKMKITG